MAGFFLLNRQIQVLFHLSSFGPLAVVEVGAPAVPAKANINNFIDPLERASTPALRRCRHTAALSAPAAGAPAAGAPALSLWPGRPGLARAAGGDGVPRTHGAGYPLPDCKTKGSTGNVLTVM
jgi:hypothetical protein